MKSTTAFLFAAIASSAAAFRLGGVSGGRTSLVRRSMHMSTTATATKTTSVVQQMSDKKQKEPEKEGLERLQDLLSKADAKGKKGPPIYEPGSYPTHLIAALAYVIPIVDSADLGKYMFEAYPDIGTAFTTLFGPVVAIYNGVPFLPFAVFFLMSYICRAPTFPVEVRFHFAQAFMLSIVQFVPSLLFGLMEKAGVPGMAVLYNTVFVWVMASSLLMQVRVCLCLWCSGWV